MYLKDKTELKPSCRIYFGIYPINSVSKGGNTLKIMFIFFFFGLATQKRRKAHRRRRLEPYAKAEGAMPFIAEEQERNQSTHAIFLCLRKKSAGCIPFLYASRKRSATISVKKKKHAPLRSYRSEGLKPPLQTSLLRRRLRRRN